MEQILRCDDNSGCEGYLTVGKLYVALSSIPGLVMVEVDDRPSAGELRKAQVSLARSRFTAVDA